MADAPPSKKLKAASTALNVLMVGTGEYTTGYVAGQGEDDVSDKGAGVVALVMFDLRSKGKVARCGMAGVNGKKFPKIRKHMQRCIGDVYGGLDLECDTYPADGTVDSKAYLTALDSYEKGDVAIIFTPDDTHFEIAMAAVERGLHVMVTKPVVKTLAEHTALLEAAKAKNVMVMVEVHKRFDPMYVDARDRMASLGGCSFMTAYMSQPKSQLETFRAWAGKSSDISYYLNSHHIDFHEWAMNGSARPTRVTATASTGVAKAIDIDTEDTITLTVEWLNLADGTMGHAVYTSSWISPKADVHSQQRFFYMGQKGEITVDQAHRGYYMCQDGEGAAPGTGLRSVNPLFMKYTPSAGKFSGQRGYGYLSFEAFVDAATEINSGAKSVADFDAENTLATIANTMGGTAILEAGRLSLDAGGQPMDILYADDKTVHPTAIKAHVF